MYNDAYEKSQGKILRLPNNEKLRARLKEKHLEYYQRREEYKRKNHIPGYGVLIGNDKTLLDAHYKEALFFTLLREGVVRTTRVYQQLKKEFRGFVDDVVYFNAVQVLSDYVFTGGSYTSGGSGFMDRAIFNELLSDTEHIRLPRDLRLVRQLRKKYHEYLGRIVDHKQHPELPVRKGILVRDAYKARILDVLQSNGSVDVLELAEELERDYAGKFNYKEYMQAAAVVRNYCQMDGELLIGGTGL
jgi:hypothetical protein